MMFRPEAQVVVYLIATPSSTSCVLKIDLAKALHSHTHTHTHKYIPTKVNFDHFCRSSVVRSSSHTTHCVEI